MGQKHYPKSLRDEAVFFMNEATPSQKPRPSMVWPKVHSMSGKSSSIRRILYPKPLEVT